MKVETRARQRPGAVVLLGAILMLVGLVHFAAGLAAIVAVFLQDLYVHPLAAHHFPNPDVPWQGLHNRLTEHLPAFSAIMLLLSGWLAAVGAAQMSSGFGLFTLRPWAPNAAKLVGLAALLLALALSAYLYLAVVPQVDEYVKAQQLQGGMEVQLKEWIGYFCLVSLAGAVLLYGITFALLAGRATREAFAQEP